MELDRDQLESLSREQLIAYIEALYGSMERTMYTAEHLRDANSKNGRTAVATLHQGSKKAYEDVLSRMRIYLREFAIANHKEQ